MNDDRAILLHTCCAPCSAAVIEWLSANGWRPVLFFCNPNIFPEREYTIRKEELVRYADSLGLRTIDGDYDHREWLDAMQGLEDEPERGARCLECFRLRLRRTAMLARESGIAVFTTTLASSRWKDLAQIALAGAEAARAANGDPELAPGAEDAEHRDGPSSVEFWDRNWRKGGLSERRRALLAENGFYNQTYCGCEFSMRGALPNM